MCCNFIFIGIYLVESWLFYISALGVVRWSATVVNREIVVTLTCHQFVR